MTIMDGLPAFIISVFIPYITRRLPTSPISCCSSQLPCELQLVSHKDPILLVFVSFTPCGLPPATANLLANSDDEISISRFTQRPSLVSCPSCPLCSFVVTLAISSQV
jgi:hypothetical protein